MSLVKQLLIAIAVVMMMAFGSSLVVSVLSAREYLEAQLQLKNKDNATAITSSSGFFHLPTRSSSSGYSPGKLKVPRFGSPSSSRSTPNRAVR
jgi:hypothetical protein